MLGERRPLAGRLRRGEQLGRVAGPTALRDEPPARAQDAAQVREQARMVWDPVERGR